MLLVVGCKNQQTTCLSSACTTHTYTHKSPVPGGGRALMIHFICVCAQFAPLTAVAPLLLSGALDASSSLLLIRTRHKGYPFELLPSNVSVSGRGSSTVIHAGWVAGWLAGWLCNPRWLECLGTYRKVERYHHEAIKMSLTGRKRGRNHKASLDRTELSGGKKPLANT